MPLDLGFAVVGFGVVFLFLFLCNFYYYRVFVIVVIITLFLGLGLLSNFFVSLHKFLLSSSPFVGSMFLPIFVV